MSASTPAVPPAAPKKLGFWRKMAYGTGDLGSAIAAGVNGFFLNPFLLDVAGLRPGVIGTIFLISRIWDAINDPTIGRLVTERARAGGGGGHGFYWPHCHLGWPFLPSGWCHPSMALG